MGKCGGFGIIACMDLSPEGLKGLLEEPETWTGIAGFIMGMALVSLEGKNKLWPIAGLGLFVLLAIAGANCNSPEMVSFGGAGLIGGCVGAVAALPFHSRLGGRPAGI